jgi:opacity protein-like surface antigen
MDYYFSIVIPEWTNCNFGARPDFIMSTPIRVQILHFFSSIFVFKSDCLIVKPVFFISIVLFYKLLKEIIMKKIMLTIVTVCLFSILASSQSAVNEGDKLIDIGVGFGSPYWGSGYKSSLPVNPRISFEKSVSDDFSVGGSVAFSSSKYDYSSFGSSYSWKVNGYFIAARGSYHFPVNKKVDPYIGGTAGYVIVTISDSEGSSGAATSGFGYGGYAGIRYFPTGKLGINAELGYTSFSFMTVGLSIKL